MKVDLPGGHHAEFRDTLLRGDVREARRQMSQVWNPDGSRNVPGTLIDDVTDAVIRRMLINWDIGQPVPRDAQNDDLAQNILAQLDEETYAVLEKAVGPWVEKVMLRGGRLPVFTHIPTGAQVQPASDDGAAKLAAHPDFRRETPEEADPKIGSSPTAITSSASQEPTGQPREPDTTPTTST